MNMNELKPCPFCGGEAEVIRSTRSMCYEEYRVGCGKCGAMVKNFSNPLWKVSYFDTEAEAIEAWNRRVSEQDGKIN